MSLGTDDCQDIAELELHKDNTPMQYYRVIALILVDIVPSWDIEGRELASVRRYPNEGQYSPISVRQPFYYIAINIFNLSSSVLAIKHRKITFFCKIQK